MDGNLSLSKSLIDMDDSILIVIDVQDFFLEKLEKQKSRLLLNHISFLIQVADKLNIPIVVTAEDIDRHKSCSEQLLKHLPANAKIHNKMVFGLATDNEILTSITETGRKTAILTGLDTDVCVAHSAIGLLQKGFSVAVVDDATGCPGTAHRYGIKRIKRAGGLIVSVRSLYYEWLRTVKNSQAFRSDNSNILNSLEGIIL